ncbi:putative crt -like protein 3-like isoform X2 [Capsicum annuum]|nr:putative crt -like protein 3-like isoform X2 [Capsicum annuum]
MPLLTSSRRLQIHRGNTWFIPRRNLNSSSEFIARAVGSDSRRISGVTRELIVLNSALTLVLGLATCVLKLALVPMKEYPFFSSSGYYFWNLNSSRKFYVRAVGGDSGRISDVTTELILLNSALTLVLGVANQVLYKLALVPMKEYPFFLALVTTLGYLAIYLSILYARYRAGIVTKERVAYLKSRFLLVGLLEALGVVCGIGSDSNQMLAGIAFVWPVLMVASSAFQAAASVIKEFVFIDAASRLKGIPFSELPSFLKSGAGCFFNIGNIVSEAGHRIVTHLNTCNCVFYGDSGYSSHDLGNSLVQKSIISIYEDPFFPGCTVWPITKWI